MTGPTPSLEQLLGLESSTDGSEKPNEGGSALRRQLEAKLDELKAVRKQLDEYREKDRTRSVAELVTKHSIPPIAQKLLLNELGDAEPTDEAVTKFVAEYGELWGAKAAEASTTPEQQAATRAVQALSAHGTEQTLEPMSEEAARARYAEAKSADEIMRMVAEATQGLEVQL